MRYWWYLLVVFAVLLVGCGRQRRYADIDSYATPVAVEIERFDVAVATADTSDMYRSVVQLYNDYPVFMPLFVDQILEVEPTDTVYVAELMRNFLCDSIYRDVNDYTLETFSNLDSIEGELSKAFGRLRYFYPQITIPELYLFVSGFNRQVLFTDDILALGSDMYLGADYPLYEEVTYRYMHYGMRPACVPVDMVSVVLFRNFRQPLTNPNLLDEMLYRGKMMYFLSVLFPDAAPNEIMNYTPEQWDWCDYFERRIWSTILDSKDLFATDNLTITKYVNDGPFTGPVSQDSPGRLGTWVGWRIVDSFMEHNPEVCMQELLQMTDSQELLEMSDYRP